MSHCSRFLGALAWDILDTLIIQYLCGDETAPHCHWFLSLEGSHKRLERFLPSWEGPHIRHLASFVPRWFLTSSPILISLVLWDVVEYILLFFPTQENSWLSHRWEGTRLNTLTSRLDCWKKGAGPWEIQRLRSLQTFTHFLAFWPRLSVYIREKKNIAYHNIRPEVLWTRDIKQNE